MICEKCGIREATIYYSENINGVKREHGICSECAKDMEFADELPFAALLSGIFAAYAADADVEEENGDETEQIMCPTCKMTYKDFIEIGIFGCEDCYGVFGPLIHEHLHKLQGSDTHRGKHPKYNPEAIEGSETEKPAEDELAVMQQKLKAAIALEDYEEAARLRDEIKAYKERM